QRAQPLLVLGAKLEIVLQHDCLSIEREGAKRLIALEHLENLVNDGSEAQAEDLERHVPLAVPVGVRYDEIRELRAVGHLQVKFPGAAGSHAYRVRVGAPL